MNDRSSNFSDAELVQRVLQGRNELFAHLVRRHERAALSLAVGVIGNYEEGRDAAQDAFVTAFEKLASLETPARFAPWLLQIVKRRAIRVSERGARHKPMDHALPAASDQEREPRFSSPELMAAIGRLPEQEQTVVLMYYFDNHSVAAIAEAIDRPLGTVTKQLSRAYERLRTILQEVDS